MPGRRSTSIVPKLAGEPVRDLGGAVRRGVIDDQHPVVTGRDAFELGHGSTNDVLDVSRLIEGWDHQPDPGHSP